MPFWHKSSQGGIGGKWKTARKSAILGVILPWKRPLLAPFYYHFRRKTVGPYTPRPIFFSPTLRETLSKRCAKQGYICSRSYSHTKFNDCAFSMKNPARQNAKSPLERKSRSYVPFWSKSSRGGIGGKLKTARKSAILGVILPLKMAFLAPFYAQSESIFIGPYTPRPIFFSPTLRETLSKRCAKQGLYTI